MILQEEMMLFHMASAIYLEPVPVDNFSLANLSILHHEKSLKKL